MTLTKLARKLQLMGRLTSSCVAIALVGMCLVASGGVTAQTGFTNGRIEGQVLIADSTGDSYVPEAVVSLDGPIHFASQVDSGDYNFPLAPPGTYTIKATAPGLDTQQSVSVISEEVSEVSLRLQIARTTTDVTVAANSANVASITPSD